MDFWIGVMERKDLAQFGEDIAVKYLKHNGYQIVERNYHSPYGEIDIICKQGEVLVCVEVKARKSLKFGEPLAAVTQRKQNRIVKTAYHYLATHESESPIRFDIITLQYIPKEDSYKLEHIKNAFMGELF
jgi:putative endonuclease